MADTIDKRKTAVYPKSIARACKRVTLHRDARYDYYNSLEQLYLYLSAMGGCRMNGRLESKEQDPNPVVSQLLGRLCGGVSYSSSIVSIRKLNSS